ncbi:MAG: 6-bladed beta-propeller [Candidatus Aminicenantales bacterium]
MKKILCLFFGLFLIFALSFQAEAQKIKSVDGVQVIVNTKKPKPPKGIPTKIRLEEDFILGESDNPDESFSEVNAFAVDDKGNIYVVDFKEAVVKVFNTSGQFKLKFAQKGQGPGELNMPSGILITPQNELMIEDTMNRRLAFFSLEGKFLRNVALADKISLVNLVMDSKGNMVGRELVLEGSKMFWEVRKYDKNLKPLFTLDKVEFKNPLQGKINIFDFLFFAQIGPDDSIFYGKPEVFEIKVYNPQGKLIKKIQKEYDRVKITEKDKQEILERIPDVGFNFKDRIEFPKYYPAFQFFTIDEEGRLFVRTFEKGKAEGEYFFDVFDSEGKYIARFAHKGDLRLWRNHKLYSIEESEEGYKVIKRYSVFWKK